MACLAVNYDRLEKGKQKMNIQAMEDKKKYFITMTDAAMSGWGEAKGITSKFVVICETPEQAYVIEKNARLRPEMKHISFSLKKPHYKNAHVSWCEYGELGKVWRDGE